MGFQWDLLITLKLLTFYWITMYIADRTISDLRCGTGIMA